VEHDIRARERVGGPYAFGGAYRLSPHAKEEAETVQRKRGGRRAAQLGEEVCFGRKGRVQEGPRRVPHRSVRRVECKQKLVTGKAWKSFDPLHVGLRDRVEADEGRMRIASRPGLAASGPVQTAFPSAIHAERGGRLRFRVAAWHVLI